MSHRSVQLGTAVSVIQAGRSFARDTPQVPSSFFANKMHRGNVRRLTADITDLVAWINFTRRPPVLDRRCIDFLLASLDKTQRLQDCHGIATTPFYKA
ncbi:hypothetical protein DOTSEDRAFT_75816 [Dothistroma septosporum NZE10]|uniref:Uncharacterized protein n=1 Tax=Dothistroma septosporum (strain NZE10 / CBS 128990) TaxID=675120 RepID=N1PDY4_DOTSN|nr:hypothetical protein DOTSEDRAFT_75816 [Dothistroma septosporum NZE10]